MTWNRFFTAMHLDYLNEDEVVHGIMISTLMSDDGDGDTWCFNRPGACAIRRVEPERRWPIVIGDISKEDAYSLAGHTITHDYTGVIGPGLTAQWFACRAAELGIHFIDVEPQQIYVLDEPPSRPPVPGHARVVTIDDADLFGKWFAAFRRESVPFNSNEPTSADILHMAGSGNYWFWMDNERIVSMAGITRRLALTAAVTGVYTPYELRGRGYAAAITTAVAEVIQAEKRTPTLYTDLRVPASNRCYRRIGFRGVHTSMHFHRGE